MTKPVFTYTSLVFSNYGEFGKKNYSSNKMVALALL